MDHFELHSKFEPTGDCGACERVPRGESVPDTSWCDRFR